MSFRNACQGGTPRIIAVNIPSQPAPAIPDAETPVLVNAFRQTALTYDETPNTPQPIPLEGTDVSRGAWTLTGAGELTVPQTGVYDISYAVNYSLFPAQEPFAVTDMTRNGTILPASRTVLQASDDIAFFASNRFLSQLNAGDVIQLRFFTDGFPVQIVASEPSLYGAWISLVRVAA